MGSDVMITRTQPGFGYVGLSRNSELLTLNPAMLACDLVVSRANVLAYESTLKIK